MSPDRALRNQKKVRVQNKSPLERVRAFRKLFGNDSKVLTLINPDPDSMASVLAVKRLLWKRVSRISVAYIGEIKRLDKYVNLLSGIRLP